MRRSAGLALVAGFCFLASAAGAEELRVLSYNVHGLPSWVAGDDPARRFPAIGARLRAFDLVLLQEDFAHHEALRATTRLPVLLRGNPSARPWCPVCNGAGLTLGASEAVRIDTLVNHPYERCAGWLGGANDCFATKGFQLARIRSEGGATLHVLNTHLDAGHDEDDRAAREAQIAEIVDMVDERVGDRALLLAGDLNLRDGDADDEALRRGLMRALSLEDSGARANPGSAWSVLDYMFVRSGSDTELRVLDAGEAPGFAVSGTPLSDHPPLFAVIELLPR